MNKIPQKFYNTAELSKIFGVHKNTIYDWINRGRIPAFMIGGRLKISADDLKAFLDDARIELEE